MNFGVIWHQGVSKQSNYQPVWQQKQRERTVKELRRTLLLSRALCVFLSRWSSWGFPLFSLPNLRPVVVFSLLWSWWKTSSPLEREKRAGLPSVWTIPSDQSAVGMTTLCCLQPIGFCSQRRGVSSLVGRVKTSQLKLLQHREKSSPPAAEQSPEQTEHSFSSIFSAFEDYESEVINWTHVTYWIRKHALTVTLQTVE